MRSLPDPLGEADDVIRRSLMRRRGMFDPEDFEDLRSEALLRLIRRVEDRDAEPIASLPDYAAMIAFHVVDDYARKRYPDRARISNRIRFTLTRDPRFAFWELGREHIGGLRGWSGRRPVAAPPHAHVEADDIPGSLLRLFEESGGPLAFHAVVALFWTPGRPLRVIPVAPQPVEQANVGAKLWKEIRELPPRQRIALLLHLRDDNGESALVHVGASSAEIAAALELPEEELAALWPALPLDDTAIAARLGLARQQVINLRKCARERLARRMARW